MMIFKPIAVICFLAIANTQNNVCFNKAEPFSEKPLKFDTLEKCQEFTKLGVNMLDKDLKLRNVHLSFYCESELNV